MIGRTHGVHAEPMTLGLKLALWYAEIVRDIERVRHARAGISVGKLSGAVGTFAHLPPAIEADVCRRLGLEPAAVASQVIQRDRHAELLSAIAITGASLEKFALEIRGLQQTEIGEIEEPFAKGQKGSSAMPHKRNPIGCEQIVGLARLLRSNAQAAFENIALWHERDISHSSVERVILPDSFIALDHMLRRFTRIVRGMVVYPGADARESRAVARSRVLGHCPARARQARRVTRAGVRVGAAKRDALLCGATGFQGAAARRPDVIERARPRRDRASLRSGGAVQVRRRHLRSRVWSRSRAPASSTLECRWAWEQRQPRGRQGVAMRARVFVTLKPSVFDPRAERSPTRSTRSATPASRMSGRENTSSSTWRRRKSAQAKALAGEVADKLLANPVIESYRVEVE